MKTPKTFRELLKTPERMDNTAVCNHSNWGRGYCRRRTWWRCGECGHPVCATHAGWHAKPPSKTWGTVVCQGTYTLVRFVDGRWRRA